MSITVAVVGARLLGPRVAVELALRGATVAICTGDVTSPAPTASTSNTGTSSSEDRRSPSAQDAATACSAVATLLDECQTRGGLSADARAAAEARISYPGSIDEAVKGAAWVVEACADKGPTKRRVLAAIEGCCARTAIITTNSLNLPLRMLRTFVAVPTSLIVARFLVDFNADVEMIAGPGEADSRAWVTVERWLTALGKGSYEGPKGAYEAPGALGATRKVTRVRYTLPARVGRGYRGAAGAGGDCAAGTSAAAAADADAAAAGDGAKWAAPSALSGAARLPALAPGTHSGTGATAVASYNDGTPAPAVSAPKGDLHHQPAAALAEPTGGAQVVLASRVEVPAVSAETPAELLAMASVIAPAAITDASRPPVALTVAIDCSGSMQGSKLRLCKRTLTTLLRELRPCDRVALVRYSSEIDVVADWTHITSDGLHTLQDIINGLTATGVTNLSGGLFAAVDLHARDAAAAEGAATRAKLGHESDGVSGEREGDDNQRGSEGRPEDDGGDDTSDDAISSARGSASSVAASSTSGSGGGHGGGNVTRGVLLLTDGQANNGIRDTPTLVSTLQDTHLAGVPGDLPVFCFGYGSDCNSDMLRAIAAASGSGLYFSILDEPAIGVAFAECIGGLVSVTASEVTLHIEARPGTGARIRKVLLETGVTTVADGTHYAVRMGAMPAEARRDVLFRVYVPKASEAAASSHGAPAAGGGASGGDLGGSDRDDSGRWGKASEDEGRDASGHGDSDGDGGDDDLVTYATLRLTYRDDRRRHREDGTAAAETKASDATVDIIDTAAAVSESDAGSGGDASSPGGGGASSGGEDTKSGDDDEDGDIDGDGDGRAGGGGLRTARAVIAVRRPPVAPAYHPVPSLVRNHNRVRVAAALAEANTSARRNRLHAARVELEAVRSEVVASGMPASDAVTAQLLRDIDEALRGLVDMSTYATSGSHTMTSMSMGHYHQRHTTMSGSSGDFVSPYSTDTQLGMTCRTMESLLGVPDATGGRGGVDDSGGGSVDVDARGAQTSFLSRFKSERGKTPARRADDAAAAAAGFTAAVGGGSNLKPAVTSVRGRLAQTLSALMPRRGRSKSRSRDRAAAVSPVRRDHAGAGRPVRVAFDASGTGAAVGAAVGAAAAVSDDASVTATAGGGGGGGDAGSHAAAASTRVVRPTRIPPILGAPSPPTMGRPARHSPRTPMGLGAGSAVSGGGHAAARGSGTTTTAAATTMSAVSSSSSIWDEPQ